MSLRRRKNGTFARGNTGGPGRPKKARRQRLADPNEHLLLMDIDQQLNNAWEFLLQHSPPEKLRQLVDYTIGRGQRVPEKILNAIRRPSP